MRLFLSANFNASLKRVFEGGREYLIAPMTLIVPGVLNGSRGPLYYPPEEVGKNPAIWNNVPIVVEHPRINGRFVSAQAKGILEKSGVGMIRNARFNKKLIADGWFDVARLKQVRMDILDRLAASRPVELSTGLLTENEPAATGAQVNGRAYSFVARNYQPDHLAILPDSKGACSIDDGCGVLVNGEPRDYSGRFTGCYLTIEEKMVREVDNGCGGKKKSKKPKTRKTNMNEATKQQREAVVNALIETGCCWTKDDREVLNSLSDRTLKSLGEELELNKKRDTVLNAAAAGIKLSDGRVHVLDLETGQWHISENEDMGGQDKGDEMLPVEKRLTSEEQEDLAFARNERKRQKDAIIEQLTANLEEEAKKRAVSVYNTLPMDQLRLLPIPARKEEAMERNVRYVGAAGVANTKVEDEDDFLPIPTMNFQKEGE